MEKPRWWILWVTGLPITNLTAPPFKMIRVGLNLSSVCFTANGISRDIKWLYYLLKICLIIAKIAERCSNRLPLSPLKAPRLVSEGFFIEHRRSNFLYGQAKDAWPGGGSNK
jgi:hypothetical protein